jgi:alpha-L-rhamnosidase
MFIEKVKINAKWIWTENNTKKNTWVCFRKKFDIASLPPKKVLAKISAETKYYLYINSKLVVFEGSLNRGPFENDGYIDFIDITKYLCIGINTIAVLAWFWGNEGRNNINSTYIILCIVTYVIATIQISRV